MNTAFDVELTDTLRDLADEGGPGPTNLALTALRNGRQIRRRRAAVSAMAVMIALVVLAAPAVVVTRRIRAASGASHQNTTDVEVVISPSNKAQAFTVLRKRFTDAGFTVLSARLSGTVTDPSLIGAPPIEFRLGSALPRDPASTLVAQLTGPGIMEFRTVLDSVRMPPLTSVQMETATDQQAKDPTLASVKAKLGAAYVAASNLTGPATLDAATTKQFAAFADLTWTEVAVLPARIQFNVPTINCAQIVDPEPPRPSHHPLPTRSSPAMTSFRILGPNIC